MEKHIINEFNVGAGTLNKIICEIVDSCAVELNKEKTKQKIEVPRRIPERA